MKLDLLRHGETTAGKVYLGRTDAPLTDSGWQQMRDTLASHQPDQWQRVISSPLLRCQAFACDWASDVQISPAIAEYDFGDWDGLDGALIYDQQPDALTAFWQDPVNNPPPNGESLTAFAERVTGFLDQLQQQGLEHVLLVTHGGVIRLLKCLVAGEPLSQMLNFEVSHGTLHSLEWPAP